MSDTKPEQASDHAYFSKFAISNSALKDWKTMSPRKWYNMWIAKTAKRPFKAATVMGSLVDCMIFTPTDTEKRFIISEVPKPSDKVNLILTEILEHYNDLNKNAALVNAKPDTKVKIPMKEPNLEDKELVVSFCIKNDHYAKKPDQAYNDVIKKGAEFFEFLKKSNGKIVVSVEEKEEAKKLQEILFTDPVSRPFFSPKKNCEVIFQQRIYTEFEVTGFENIDFLPFKGACDIIHFNHKRKEVREVDLKVTADAFMFWESIRKFDYPQQHSFYDCLIKLWLETYQDGKYKDYSVMNPLNVVIDNDLKVPYIYAYNSEDLHIKRYGIENTPIKGWEDTVKEIAWHMDTQQWDRPREHMLNGYINVRVFNKR